MQPREQDSTPSLDPHQLVDFGKLHDHPKPLFSHIQNGDIVYLMVVIKINSLIYEKSWYLPCTEGSVYESHY